MKTEDFYLSKIRDAKLAIEKYNLSLEALKNPKPLKPSKEKTKIISFRVPVSRVEELRKICADAIITALNKTEV